MISLEKVKAVIDVWDPIGLYDITPKDEYASEAKEIYSYLQTCTDVYTVAVVVYMVFLEAFGTDVFKKSIDDCITIAEKLVTQ